MAEKKTIEIEVLIKTAQSAKTLGELKTALTDIKSALSEIGEENTEDIEKLNQALTETTNRMKPLQDAADKASTRLDKLKITAERFDGVSKTLSGSISLAAGSIGLFGKAGEKTAQVLLKVQSAIAISNGIKDLSEGFLKLATTTGIASSAQAAYAAVVGTSTGALKLFKVAMTATGIGLLVVLIGALITNFDKVVDSVEKVSEKFNSVKIVVDILKMAYEGLTMALEDLGLIQSRTAKASEDAANSYRGSAEVYKEETNKIVNEINRQLEARKAAGEDITELEKKRLDILLERTAIQIKLERGILVNLNKNSDEYKNQEKIIAALIETYKDLQNGVVVYSNTSSTAIKKTNDEVKKSNEDLIRKIEDNNIKLIQDETRKNIELLRLNNSRRKAEIEGEIRLLNLKTSKSPEEIERVRLLNEFLTTEQQVFFQEQKKLLDEYNLSLKTSGLEPINLFKKEIEGLKKLSDPTIFGSFIPRNFESDLKNIALAFNSVGQAALASNTLAGDSISTINNLFTNFAQNYSNLTNNLNTLTDSSASNQERLEAGASFINTNLGMIGEGLSQISQIIENNTNRNIENINREANERIAAAELQFRNGVITEESLNNTKQQIALDAYNKETELKRKAFEQNKKLQIANATVSMLQGALTAFSTAFQLGPIAGPIVGSILSASVLALGAVQIANIKKTKFDAGSPPSFTAPSTQTPTLPDTNVNSPNPNNTNLQLFGTAGSGSTNQRQDNSEMVMRAYVVESDISDSQNRINRYRTAAEIG